MEITLTASGGDDSVAINAALQDPNITAVHLAAGAFHVSSGIIVPSGKSLTGAGTGVTSITANPDFVRGGPSFGVVESALGATNVYLADFTVDAAKLRPEDVRMCGVYMHQAVDFVIERVDVQNATGYGHFAQGDLNAYVGGVADAARASGTYTDCNVVNSEVSFEQMFADGVTLTRCVAGDGDGDITAEAHFHALSGSANIKYIDCVSVSAYHGGFLFVPNIRQLENISVINCTVDVQSSNAIVVAGVFPLVNLDIQNSSFVSHELIAARLGGVVNGTVTASSFLGHVIGADFGYLSDGSSSTISLVDTNSTGFANAGENIGVYGVNVFGDGISWSGGAIVAQGKDGSLYPVSGSPNLADGVQLVRDPYEASYDHIVGSGPLPLFSEVNTGIAGGAKHIVASFELAGDAGDTFTLRDDAGNLTFADGQILSGGAYVGQYAFAAQSLLIVLAPDADATVTQQVVDSIHFDNSAPDHHDGVRIAQLTLTSPDSSRSIANVAIDLVDLVSPIDGDGDANTLVGTAGDDALRGFGGDDLLDGAAGQDIMIGGTGNDIYYVDNAGDRVFEVAGEGVDRIYSTVNYTLTPLSEVELLAAADRSAADPLALTGNGLANFIFGNEGSNVLTGAGGDDVLRGFGGADVLDGGSGMDQMLGGAGNDTYYVDSLSDQVIEKPGEGYDYVYTSVSFALASGSEAELLAARDSLGVDPIKLVGNEFNNWLTGNEGNNKLAGYAGIDTLRGMGGSDLIDGGAGADWLYGGSGADSFTFASLADAQGDHVMDFQSGVDILDFSRIDIDPATDGRQGLVFEGSGHFTDVAGQVIFADGHLLIDANGDGTADYSIELNAQPNAGDFQM